nr:unnamed protein product [Spirometra erinaceieuropaei]
MLSPNTTKAEGSAERLCEDTQEYADRGEMNFFVAVKTAHGLQTKRTAPLLTKNGATILMEKSEILERCTFRVSSPARRQYAKKASTDFLKWTPATTLSIRIPSLRPSEQCNSCSIEKYLEQTTTAECYKHDGPQLMTETKPREIRHLDYISQFTSDIRHIDGSQNAVTDALSGPSDAHLQFSPEIDLAEMTAEQRRVGSPCDEDVSGPQLQELPPTTGNSAILCEVFTPSIAHLCHHPFAVNFSPPCKST